MHNKNQFYLAAWGSKGIQTLFSTLIKTITAWLLLIVRLVPFFVQVMYTAYCTVRGGIYYKTRSYEAQSVITNNILLSKTHNTFDKKTQTQTNTHG